MIELQGITKSFGSLQVLKGIDLKIENGEIVSIVGPSGAGKTTLLQIMGTLDKPESGRVIYDDVNVNKMSGRSLSAFRNKHIGFVFQFHQLLPEFTALENVLIPAYIAGRSKKQASADAMEVLNFMGLANRASHKPNELSGGEKQRVAVARALINHPNVILADEPSGSLDTKNKEELHQLFFDLRKQFGQTFVIVTHDEKLAQITDRTLHMLDGVITDDGTDHIQAGPTEDVTGDLEIALMNTGDSSNVETGDTTEANTENVEETPQPENHEEENQTEDNQSKEM